MSTTDFYNATVRPAEEVDRDLLVELGSRTFRDTFAVHNKPEDMELYLAQAFSKEQVSTEMAASGSRFFIAEMDDQPAGYAYVRGAPAPDGVSLRCKNPLELVRCYACGAWIGFGVGKALMRNTIEFAQAQGRDGVWLGVWEHNDRAIAFYKKWNFEKVGKKSFLLGEDLQTDFVMALCF